MSSANKISGNSKAVNICKLWHKRNQVLIYEAVFHYIFSGTVSGLCAVYCTYTHFVFPHRFKHLLSGYGTCLCFPSLPPSLPPSLCLSVYLSVCLSLCFFLSPAHIHRQVVHAFTNVLTHTHKFTDTYMHTSHTHTQTHSLTHAHTHAHASMHECTLGKNLFPKRRLMTGGKILMKHSSGLQ